MNAPFSSLRVIDSCDGCGACCRVVTHPPFRTDFGTAGEDAWERLRWERPDLLAELIAEERARRASGRPDYGTPCTWYDAETGRCRHYDYRPRACREFAVGGVDCLDARRRAGID
jgi:Fe-S-cluster containining protein